MEVFNQNIQDILQNQSSVQQSTSHLLNLNGVSIVEPIEVDEDIQAIHKFWDGMVEADQTAKTKFSEAQGSVKNLQATITSFVDAIGKNGSKVASLDINQLNAAIFDDKQMVEMIIKKLENDNALSPAERELLYKYIHEVVFDKDDHAYIKKISRFMEYDKENLEKHINEVVLESEASLEREILLLELYLFSGNERPGGLQGNRNERIKLHSYLDLLKNYHIAINEVRHEMEWAQDKDVPLLARIEYLDFNFDESPIRGHSKSDITIDIYQNERLSSELTREEFLALENLLTVRRNASEVDYFFGSDGVTDLKEKHKLKLEDELSVHTQQYITGELFGLALRGGWGAAYSFISSVGGHAAEHYEKQERLTFEKLEQTAIDFHLELQVNTRDVPGSTQDIQVQIHPTEETFNLVERWKTIHQIDGTFPYPKDELQKQNWSGINEFLYDDGNKVDMKMDEENQKIYEYIIKGTPSDHPAVQEAMRLSGY